MALPTDQSLYTMSEVTITLRATERDHVAKSQFPNSITNKLSAGSRVAALDNEIYPVMTVPIHMRTFKMPLLTNE